MIRLISAPLYHFYHFYLQYQDLKPPALLFYHDGLGRLTATLKSRLNSLLSEGDIFRQKRRNLDHLRIGVWGFDPDSNKGGSYSLPGRLVLSLGLGLTLTCP